MENAVKSTNSHKGETRPLLDDAIDKTLVYEWKVSDKPLRELPERCHRSFANGNRVYLV